MHNVIQSSLGKLELRWTVCGLRIAVTKGTYRFDLLHKCGLLEGKHSAMSFQVCIFDFDLRIRLLQLRSFECAKILESKEIYYIVLGA